MLGFCGSPRLIARSTYLAGVAEGSVAYHGHEGLKRYFQDLSEAWQIFQVDIGEYRDAGDVVVAIGDLKARGRSSGVEVDRPLAWLITIRGGKATRVQVFLDPTEALKAAGLSE